MDEVSSSTLAALAVNVFAHAILHGNAEHKDWLLKAAEQFNDDGTVPPPRGI